MRTCFDVQAWLLRPPDALDITQPHPWVADHVRGCARCRGALALLVGALAGGPLDATPQPCEAYEDRLPVFAEHAAMHGTVAAARQLPDVWWHLVTCEECVAVYELLVVAMEAERAGDLPPPPLLMRPVAPLLTLARPFLNLALAPALRLGPARGDASDPAVILEDPTATDVTLTVSVREQPPEHWSVIVQIAPPPCGTLVLTLGDATFRAAIDAQGIATVDRVPAEMLAAPGGPDLVIGVELSS